MHDDSGIYEDVHDPDFDIPEENLLPDDAELSLGEDIFVDGNESEDASPLDGELEPEAALSEDLPEIFKDESNEDEEPVFTGGAGEEGEGEIDFEAESEGAEEARLETEPILETDAGQGETKDGALMDAALDGDFDALEGDVSGLEPERTQGQAEPTLSETSSASAAGGPAFTAASAPSTPPQAQKAGPASPDPAAQAKMFDYLLGLTKDLPKNKLLEAAQEHLPSRLRRISDELRKIAEKRAKPTVLPLPTPDASGEEVFVNTFSMLGNIGKFLPAEQKQDLRNRMKRVIDMMEKYRKP